VSGDFYWFSEIKNGVEGNDFGFAAVDCTGHGVPGAFMSMVGMKALHAITGSGITKTDQILSFLHTEIRNALRQEETGNNDGMDVALCIYRKHKRLIEFSGAKNPLVYIKNNEMFQVKGDLHPIGGSKSKQNIVFKRHEILIDSPTTIYLFSDGFRDQFGGKDNTKFMSKKFTQLLFKIHQHPMEKQREMLAVALEQWKGNGHQTDDILVMGVKLEGS
jgi:serine phosphatase RsbU (regulator of sigma subunit)